MSTGHRVIVAETYTCGKVNGNVEWGFGFRYEDSDDSLFDLVLGEDRPDELLGARIAESFLKHQWAADAICTRAP